MDSHQIHFKSELLIKELILKLPQRYIRKQKSRICEQLEKLQFKALPTLTSPHNCSGSQQWLNGCELNLLKKL